MSVHLSSEQPFRFTKALLEKTKIKLLELPIRTILETIKKICLIAMNILLMIPAFIIDSSISLLSYFFTKGPVQKDPKREDQRFFQQAIKTALFKAKPENMNRYLSLMEQEINCIPFFSDDRDDFVKKGFSAPFNIVKWCASCLILNYIQKDAKLKSPFSKEITNLAAIEFSFKFQPEDQKKSISEKIYNPEVDVELSQEANILLAQIDTQALEISLSNKFKESIYRPSISSIRELIFT